MTIYDISEKAGVSIATVSRVLNGSSSVSEKTRQKVLDVIEQYGYTPNAFARGLGLNTMKTIGIMCADSSDLYLAKAVYYIEQKLRASGYDSLLCCTGYELASKTASMNLLITKKVDGIILAGSNFVYEKDQDNRYIAEAAAQIPVMLLNASMDAPNVYSVMSDDYTSMYEATRQMLSDGIEDILYFYNSQSYSGKKKLAGFRAAMAEAHPGQEPLTEFYRGSHEDIHAMVRHLNAVRDKGARFHGVIAADDTLALAAVKYAAEAGYRIPEDFSVIGYNNSMLTECCEPELTSIDNKLETLCQHLITTLLGILEEREMPKKTVFSGEIIRRGTTRK
ncbi:LacI family DNA-binding transcriptional regulator [Acetatifactor aquisgranensis]|uniref:LacI family DNA-binding transcriptional regulator n=1 Tax=Acetatifactor aquisgranensis TaxID=2941233 RepID=UPI00203AF8EA|nr:LacI family DNA-binding transcriptional regulator [Acetatifactor aquisgranensis]